MIVRCGLKSCPLFSAPCESEDFDFVCPCGEANPWNFIEIRDTTDEFFCLVVGSRSFTDYKLFSEKMDIAIQKTLGNIYIITGGADGTDSMAERYAKERGYYLYVINADWSRGKSAGYVRNEEMHRFISQHENRGCIAFWDGESKGTQHSFELAKKYNNQLRVVKING